MSTLLVAWVVFPIVLLRPDARMRSRARGAARDVPFRFPAASRRLRGRGGPHGLRDDDRCDGRARRAARGRRSRSPGSVVGYAGLRRRLEPWAAGAGAAAYAVFAAPPFPSGEATFAGYIKLDDTVDLSGITDRVLEHGRNLDGLAPSTYEATLECLGDGYPVGSCCRSASAPARRPGPRLALPAVPRFLAAPLALGCTGSRGSSAAAARVRATRSRRPPALLSATRSGAASRSCPPRSLLALWPRPRRRRGAAGHGAAWSGAPRRALLACSASAGRSGSLPLAAAARSSRMGAPRARGLALPGSRRWLLALPALVRRHDLPRRRQRRRGGTDGSPTSSARSARRRSPESGRPGTSASSPDCSPPWCSSPSPCGVSLGRSSLSPARRMALLALGGLALAGAVVVWAPARRGSTRRRSRSLAGRAARGWAGAAWLSGAGAASRRRRGGRGRGGVLWSNALAYQRVWLAPRGQLAELESIGERSRARARR